LNTVKVTVGPGQDVTYPGFMYFVHLHGFRRGSAPGPTLT